MAYIVAEPCVNCKFTDCVTVCPVDCFREGENFLVIDPDICIDCGACVPECPAEAIFSEDDLPGHWKHYTKINRDLASDLPEITEQKDSMPDADDWKTPGKGKWTKIGAKDGFIQR